MNFDKMRQRERGHAGEQLSPRSDRKSLEQERAAKAADIRRHPERAPGPVKRLSREEIERLFGNSKDRR